MNLETIIAEKVHALPTVKQAKVLAFVEDLTVEDANGNKSSNGQTPETSGKSKRYSFIGIGESKSGDISERAEEILEQEIKSRSG
jgi:hypothetical protein